MGATLVLALLLGSRAYIANLGDSRAYRLRHGRLVQLSRDHSVVAELVEQGHITSQEAEHHEDQGVITQYAGMDKRARSHVRSFAFQQGDRLLLCSDGLTDMVDKRHIRRVLAKEPECQPCCDTLVALANKAGGHDNITVLVIHWLG
jgi:protein phosphatase